MSQKVDASCLDCTATFEDADDARAHEDAQGHRVNFGAAYTPVEDLPPERRREAYRNTEPRTPRERHAHNNPRARRADY